MVLLTTIISVIGILACLVALGSALSVGYDVTKMILSSSTEQSEPVATNHDLWLAQLEQESYIMSLRVVGDETSTADAQDFTQEEINQRAANLKEHLSVRRSNYELLNQQV